MEKNKKQTIQSNPFQDLEDDVDDEQLQTWQEMNRQVRGLVQMSDDEDDNVEHLVDDSLLVTNVTAESFGLPQQLIHQPSSQELSGMADSSAVTTSFATEQFGSTVISTFPASMELTLQYLSGKISLLEFTEMMDKENNPSQAVDQEIGLDIQDIEDSQDLAAASAAAEDDGEKDQDEDDDDYNIEDDNEDSQFEKEILKNIGKGKKKRKRKVGKRPTRRKCDLPTHLERMMGEVNMIYAQGDHERAIKECLEIIRLAPNACKPFQTLGMIYDYMGDVQKSLQYYLIAAYLVRTDYEEWARLAELFLEQNDIGQAVKCYTKAISAKGENLVHCLWERSKLYESLKDYRRALEGYQTILTHLPESDSEKYFQLAWKITRSYVDLGEKVKAIETMTKAFTEHPDQITSEDVNLLLELLIPEKKYLECLAIFVKHCGVQFTFFGNKQWTQEHPLPLDEIQERTPTSCKVPEMLPIDLRVKLALCLIHLDFLQLVQSVVEPLLEEDIEVNGDLYLDIAEAYMENSRHKEAELLLKKLVNSQNYNLAAVWLRYGECLKSLGEIQGAVDAYSKVVQLAPSHVGARMTLSALQQQLGKHDEALEALEPDDLEDRKLTKEEEQMMLQKCHLLNAQGKLDEFYHAAKQLLFSEWRELEAEKMTHLQAISSYKHRKDSLKSLFLYAGKDTKIVSNLTSIRNRKTTVRSIDLWEMFLSLCVALLEKRRVAELENITLLGMLCPVFSENSRLKPDFTWLLVTAAIITKNPSRSYFFGRQIVIENVESVQAWNMFMQVIMVCNDQRHNRFCLRKMMSEPNNVMLGIMNGHNSLVSGSYKHSLGEYANVFRRNPTDPLLSLCIGLDFIHLSSQRFAAKRSYLITQGFAFLNNYLELRGECQETYYNLGRALHQLNVLYAAIHYYKKALSFPPCIGDRGGMFDLTNEIAYNLSLIYQGSGSTEYARYLLYKYCVI